MESAEQGPRHRADGVERLHQQLRESIHALVTSEDWRQALSVAARFHNYSFANTQLIWSQAAARGFTPSRVAGYRTWQTLGRQVRRGERGLPILAPVTRKIETPEGEEEERRVVGFRVVHVFDQSQTDGEPIPEIRAALVEGDLPAHWERVAELITSAGFSLEVADIDRLGEANGITDWQDRQVVVRESLPGAQRFKTAVHELAHIQLHEPTSGGRPNCRGIVEVEAESVAYMVCAALGVDSAGYSLPYVAAWSGGDLDKVASTADRVMRCARQVLDTFGAEQDLTLDRRSPELTTAGHGQPLTTEKRLPDPAAPRPADAHWLELQEALGCAVAFYQAGLDHRDGAQARAALDKRGLSEESVSRWQLGYAPARWDALVQTLRSQGISDKVLLEAGLAGRARTGRLYDRMRARIIFPIFDEQGSPRGFAGRLIAGDGPKYLNSPETPLYSKSALLYGLHLARPAIANADQAVIVEGYTDAIAAHQAGITNTVATGGTALTSQHIEGLRPVASTLILAFDGDQAGLTAAQRVAELPRPTVSGLSLQVARLPEGRDPADLLADEIHILQDAITNPTPLLHHLLDHVVGQHNLDEPEALVRALRAAGPVIARLTDSSDRGLAISYLAASVGRDKNIVESVIQRNPTGHRRDMDRSASQTIT